jgi:hypothetical protein
MTEKKEAFVPREDRPDPKITLDRPVSELTVRDLVEILYGHPPIHKTHKDKDREAQFAFQKLSVAEHTVTGAHTTPYGNSLVKALQDKVHLDNAKLFKEPLKPEIDLYPLNLGFGPPEGLAQFVAGLTEKVGQLADQVSQLAAREQK